MLVRSKHRMQRGDTLIEVLFAITVFSLIVVSALALMNQGTAASQRSLEITLVRQQIDSQAEALRFLQASYVQNYASGTPAPGSPAAEYQAIIAQVSTTPAASEFGTVPCDAPPANSFVLNTRQATAVTDSGVYVMPDTFAQVSYDDANEVTTSGGIWIEGVRSGATGNTGYIDFHIRGCWAGLGLDEPMNIGTIVRLYEPRG